MKTRGLIDGFFIIFILLLLTSPLLSQPVVLDAKPTVLIFSDASSTTRSVLSKAAQDNSRIRIAKQGTDTSGYLVKTRSWCFNYPVRFITSSILTVADMLKFWTRTSFSSLPNQHALPAR